MRILFFLLLPLLLITSCGKDDDDGGGIRQEDNSGNFDGLDFDLAFGTIEDFGINPDGVSYDWDVTLSSDFNVVAGGLNFAIINLDLNSDSPDGLRSGTYQWAAERAPFTFVDSGASITNANGGVTVFLVSEGTVEVTRSGNNYRIEFDLKNAGDQRLRGTFDGPLREE